jgi:hypothetical protein
MYRKLVGGVGSSLENVSLSIKGDSLSRFNGGGLPTSQGLKEAT